MERGNLLEFAMFMLTITDAGPPHSFDTFEAALGEMAREMSRVSRQIEGSLLSVEYTRHGDGDTVPVADFRFEGGEWRGMVRPS